MKESQHPFGGHFPKEIMSYHWAPTLSLLLPFSSLLASFFFSSFSLYSLPLSISVQFFMTCFLCVTALDVLELAQ